MMALCFQLHRNGLALIVTAKISESRSVACSKATSMPINRRYSKKREGRGCE
jgi:hypothetical protein